jgi:hypothetical protein
MSSSTRSSISLLGIGDDLSLEALLDLVALHQLANVRETDVLLEPLVAPLVHREDDVLDLGHPRLEVALHVFLVELQLRLDVLGHLEVVLEQAHPLVHREPVAPHELFDDPQRALQLQPHPALLVQKVLDVTLQLLEAARTHEGVGFYARTG